MKRWIILGLVAVAAIAATVLVVRGDITWETLSILAAPFIAVFKGIGDLLKGKDDEEALIKQLYDERRAKEDQYHGQIEASMRASDARVEELAGESARIDARLAELSKQREAIEREVKAMSTEELADSVRRLFSSRHAEG